MMGLGVAGMEINLIRVTILAAAWSITMTGAAAALVWVWYQGVDGERV